MQSQELTQVDISVSEPLMEKSDSLNFITYLVKGKDSNGQFCIRRRYRDFNVLREHLVTHWIGIYIPPIDSKKLTGNTDKRFVESRKRFLNYFCQKIAERTYLYNCYIFQTFIRGDEQFAKVTHEVTKELNSVPSIEYSSAVQSYQKYFTKFTQKISSAEIHLNNENDYEFLKKTEKKLQQIRNEFREVVDADKSYKAHFSNIVHKIDVCLGKLIPEYEQKSLIQHVQGDKNKLIIQKDSTFSDQLTSMNDTINSSPFEAYAEMISLQLREIRAFLQAIQNRKEAEKKKEKFESKRRDGKEELQKLRAGKTTLKLIFLPGSKQEQARELELLIPQCESNENSLSRMIALMNAVNNQQIQKFKQKRNTTYINTLLSAAKKQLLETAEFGKLFKIPLLNKA